MVPFQQGRGHPAPAGRVRRARGPSARRACTSRPSAAWSRRTPTYPRRGGRIERSIDDIMERSKYERTWELVQRMQGGVRHAPGLHPHGRRLPAPARVPLRGAPARHARRRGAAGLLHQRVPPRLLPALRGRDGPDAADGRHPGARRDRLLARRLLGEQARPGSSATPTPTPGSRCGSTSTAGSPWTPRRPPLPPAPASPRRSPPRRPPRPPRPTAATTPPPAPNDGTNPQAVRPDLQVGTDGSVARHRRRGPDGAGCSGSRWSCWPWRWCSRSCSSSAARAAPPRWTGRSRRSRTRCGASGAPSSTGTTLRELERRLGSHSPEVAAYLRALSSGRYAAGLRAAVAERAARAAAGVGARARVRRAVARAVGDAAARGAWVAARRVADVGSRNVGARVELSAVRRVGPAGLGEHTVGPRVKQLVPAAAG